MMVLSCENSLTVIKEITGADTLATVSANHIVYMRSDSGKVFMRLEAPLMLRFEEEDETTEFPEGFEVFFYDSLQQLSSRIKADYGVNYERLEIMSAKTNVEVENYTTKELMLTETLYWNQKTRRIFTMSPVKISSPDKVIYGDSLNAMEDFSSRNIFNFRATLEIEEGDDSK